MSGKKVYNQYINSAQFYDSDLQNLSNEDLVFYLSLVKRKPGDILELGCGTGRVGLFLAAEGHDFTGLDISAPMLEQFRSKIAAQHASLKDRIQLIQADMMYFDIAKKFQYILIPQRSFQVLTNDEQAISCLKAVCGHLLDNGVLAIHLFRPTEDMSNFEGLSEEKEIVNITNGSTYKRRVINSLVDTQTQILEADFYYGQLDESLINPNPTESVRVKYYFEENITQLLHKTGFTVLEKYGDFKKSPIHKPDTTEMIFICIKL